MESGQTPLEGRGSTKTKQHRVTQACDFCHRRSIRCRTSDGDDTCQNCRDYGHQCTYNRKPRRRGTQPRAADGVASGRGGSGRDTIPNQRVPKGYPDSESVAPHDAWAAPIVATQAVIVDLVELYFEIVYPIFPFFHQPTFTRRISRADYITDRDLFTVTMAVCGLVSGRVRDGALTNPRWDLSAIRAVDTDVFISQAKAHLVYRDIKTDINTLRAHAILAIASIQNSNIRDMHFHLGMYHTLIATDALHDESNWPRDIGIIEREERRRLFWSLYTLDIFTSVVWGGIIRSREKQSKVAYPTEADDELLQDDTIAQPAVGQQSTSPTSVRLNSRISANCWLSGWNFVTDLYRILEHALTRLRGHKNGAQEHTFLQNILPDEPSIAEASVSDSVLQMYFDLPHCFKETPNMTFNLRDDRFAFQAANITGTLQLVRIVLFASGGATIEARCQIAREVVDAFVSIPAPYLLAISTPLLHHLGGIGAVLGSVFEESTTNTEYRMVQSIISSMAQLLENLEPIHQSSSASQALRDNAARIEAYIESKQISASSDVYTSNTEGPTSFMRPDDNAAEGLYESGLPETTESLPMLLQSDLLDQLAWGLNFG